MVLFPTIFIYNTPSAVLITVPAPQIYPSSPLLPNFNGGYLQGLRIDPAGFWMMNFVKWVSKILSAGLGHISQPRTGPITIISKTIIQLVHSA